MPPVETPWASCCSMLWLLQTPTDSLFCLLPQAHSWISLQIFSAEFFFLINTIILFFTLPPKTKHCTGTHVEIYKLFEHQCSYWYHGYMHQKIWMFNAGLVYIYRKLTQYQGFSLTNKVHEKNLQRQLIRERGTQKMREGEGERLNIMDTYHWFI